ncbi:unnamed protein product [Colias eurytheme]|nr:unnamed protein product [Colias eurytheme]
MSAVACSLCWWCRTSCRELRRAEVPAAARTKAPLCGVVFDFESREASRRRRAERRVRARRRQRRARDQMLGQISHSPSLYLKADPEQSLREDDIKRKPHTGVVRPSPRPDPYLNPPCLCCLIDTRLTTCKSPASSVSEARSEAFARLI